MAPQQQRRAPSPLGKPTKPQGAKDGTFEFQLPTDMGSGRGRIPKGPRVGRLVSIVADTSQAGNPMWVWTFVITKGDNAGRDFKLWTALTPDAAWKVVETLAALGKTYKPGEKVVINKKELIGVSCTMHIADDKGKDGDGEFSKLARISAHPNGAGFRSTAGIAAQKNEPDAGEGDEEGADTGAGGDEDEYAVEGEGTGEVEEGGEEFVPEEEETPPAPPPRRKAPPSLGRGQPARKPAGRR